jgi:alpha-D-ribose 1-methylphosphonate 5-triphosphate synthase subunit PhnL
MEDEPMTPSPVLRVEGLTKTFTLHTQGGVRLPVFSDVSFTISAGECVVLAGPSGSGKSTLLRSLYANYLPDAGHIRVRHHETWVDMVTAEPREILAVRRETMGYVSQFLRVIPRVPTLDVVAEPLLTQGIAEEDAKQRARTILKRLALPERLWSVPPTTFSGGEQQRVNIARSFVRAYPILLLDEPTASLDQANREAVVALITEARETGAAIVAICHDAPVRDAIATSLFDVTEFAAAA